MRGRRRGGATATWFALVLSIASVIALAPIALGFTLPPSQPGQSVYDFAGIWSAGTVASAQQTADRLRAQTGVEMAIVSIPTGYDSVDTSTAESDAKNIMDTWGVGKAGVNNGIVVLFDLDTTLRHGQIYVYGGSGIISTYLSAVAAQSIADDMIARAKAGDLDGALSVGMTQIADAVDHPGSRLESAPLIALPTVVLLLVDIAILVVMFGLWWRDGRDPPIPLIDDSVLLPAPPQGLTPSMAALLHDAGPSKSAPAAALVDLASRNLLAMREGSTFLGLGHKPIDFIVSDPTDPRVANAESQVGEPERVILRELRGIAEGGVVEHTHLTRAPQMLTNFATALGKAAAATPWFRADPNSSVNRMTGVPIIGRMGLLWLENGKSGVASSTLIGIAATVATIAIGIAIAKSMAARTPQGSWVLGMALAYRNTLRHEMGQAPGVVSAQEHAKLKLPWLETPDALIVWAIALGLADEVGDLLSRSMSDPASAQWHPAWYSGSAVSFASFGSSISSITTSVASSSGGGYGGGGSGGGGGGGGGF
ncbi:MAG TPA: TPM domain-containing protein [Candidatus Limnocylindrales bacterium]